MFRFPMFGYPYNYQKYKYFNNYYNPNNTPSERQKQLEKENSITNLDKISNTIDSKPSSNNSEQAIFEIFGIKLYLDDIIILGILFFLYQQDVKDEMLYIILLLLLLS